MSFLFCAPINRVNEKTRKKRARPINKVLLTENAEQTIGHLSRFSMLSQRQLAAAMGCSRPTAGDALRLLSKNELVCWAGVRRGDVPATVACKPFRIYALTERAVDYCNLREMAAPDEAPLLDPMLGRPPLTQSWHGNIITNRTIYHQLGLVDCMIVLWRAFKRRTDYELVALTPDFIEQEDGTESTADVFVKGGEEKTIIPDIVGIARRYIDGQTSTLFVEFDRDTTALRYSDPNASSIETKFAQYALYLRNQSRRFNGPNPVLLYVSVNDDRHTLVTNQQELTPQGKNRVPWNNYGNLKDVTYLAPLHALKGDALAPIWTRIGQKDPDTPIGGS